MTYPQPPETSQNACEQAQEILFSLQEAEPVSDEGQAFVQAHLSQCQPCQFYQQSLAHLTASLSDLEPVPVPAGLSDRILAQIAVESEAIPTGVLLRSQPSAWKKYSAVAAAVLMIAVAVPLLMPQLMPNGSQKLGVTPSVAQKMNASQTTEVAAISTLQPEMIVSDEAANETISKVSSEVSREASDEAQLAFAGGSTGVGLKQTYASETESDMYYDPVTTLVGF